MLTLKHFLIEKRKNEPMNPKVPVYDYIKRHVEESRGENIYVSFTSLDKLGINPRFSFSNPIGIYFYEAKYVLDTVSPITKKMTDLPFAGEGSFVNVFTIKRNANIINLSNSSNTIRGITWPRPLTAREAVSYIEKMLNFIDSNNPNIVNQVNNFCL
jgi:hypothetical protein